MNAAQHTCFPRNFLGMNSPVYITAPWLSGNVSVPIKLLFEAEGMKITVEVSIMTS